MDRFHTFALLAMALVIVFIANQPSWAIPNAITASGYLETMDGQPLEGQFAWKIQFYPSETSTNTLATVAWNDGTSSHPANVVSGVYEITILPVPLAILGVDEVWYSVAIDTDQNGLTDSDRFENRFRVTSVPFAISAAETKYFLTDHVTEIINGPGNKNMYLTRFSTPPGGVEFNTMTVLVDNGGVATQRQSFGIYNTSGTLIATTGVLAGGSTHIAHATVSGYLQPSTIYLAAWGVGDNTGDGNFGVSYGGFGYGAPLYGKTGVLNNVVQNGQIPNQINPNAISFADSFPIAPVIGLTKF